MEETMDESTIGTDSVNATEDAGALNAQSAMGSGTPAKSDVPETPDERKALVTQKIAEIKRGKKKLDKAFKKMREDMRFVGSKQWEGQTDDDDRYTLNLAQRHVNQRVATLYAKNPKAVAKRRPKRDFTLWDETPESMQEAMAVLQGAHDAAAEGIQAGDPHAMTAHGITQNDPALMTATALLRDIVQGQQKRKLYDSVAKTLEMLYGYFIEEQQPRFKTRLKKAVKRAIICGVAYVKLGFLRETEKPGGYDTQIADMSERLAFMQQAQKDITDGEIAPDSADFEELKLALQALQQNPEVIKREGLTFDFPLSTRIIFDPKCTQLVDWVGCDWIAEEHVWPKEQVERHFSIEIGENYLGYADEDATSPRITNFGNMKIDAKREGDMVCWWEMYDKITGLACCMADGYPDFLREPGSPQVELERFFPIWPLVFNEMESEEGVIPDSDVRLLRSPQKEYNRSKEAVRQHRIANQPRYVNVYGALDDEDAKNIALLKPHHSIDVKGLGENVDINKLIQRLPTQAIDPNLYEVSEVMNDIMRVVGQQPASMGGTSGDTATEVSIAQSSQDTVGGSNGDDLDDLLTDMARCGGQVLLREMSADQVIQIVGPGAVWPTLTGHDIAKEIFLEVQAGSSGSPNRAQDIANFQRLAPMLTQLPGLNPVWLAKYAIGIMDANIDPTDAILAGAQSVQALNTAATATQGSGAAPAAVSPGNNAPEAQGPTGGANAPQPPGQESPGGQAAMPAPHEGSTVPYDATGKRVTVQ